MLDVAGNKYKLTKKLGAGSFGEIYLGVSKEGEEVAVKLESLKSIHNQLKYESSIYQLLQGGVGIPTKHYFGTEGTTYNVLVVDLLGPSLEDMFNMCGRIFSLKTVLMLADQLIRRIEYVHSKNYLHRDIKPDNFLMGVGKMSNVIYLIDFGLSKKYFDVKSGKYAPYRECKPLTGTARYASINSHVGIEQSRRDDIEALGLIFIYFAKGSLPWQGLKATTKEEKYKKIAECKIETSVEELTKGLPPQFGQFMNYARSLSFTAAPDYTFLRGLFRGLFLEMGYSYDFKWDWTELKYDYFNIQQVQPPANTNNGTTTNSNNTTNNKSNVQSNNSSNREGNLSNSPNHLNARRKDRDSFQSPRNGQQSPPPSPNRNRNQSEKKSNCGRPPSNFEPNTQVTIFQRPKG